ncbi:MAG TPA: 2-dehydropantoate 2-reductase [Chloroflexota bacterium]|nr:2-dehydropantoate 2-reductase [Chloroflexota bacterium]
MIKRIAVMGAGAIGSVVGGMLTRAGRDVTLIDQWPAHVVAMQTGGLRLSGTCGEHVVPVKAVQLCDAQAIGEPFDAIFLAVKGYDTDWATLFAIRFLSRPDGVIVDFQNGMNDERVAALAGRDRTLGCVITIGAGMYEPGHALRTDTGTVGFKIGELDGRETERARELVRIVDDVAGARLTTNLFGERWSKLATNCMANPLAGLSGLGSAEIRSEPVPRRIAIQLAAEVIRVGRAAGYEVEPIFGVEAQRFVDAAEGRGAEMLESDMAAGARSLAGGRPSLLQDVLRGRRTEIEELNGFVVARGRELGVPTPMNAAVVAEVQRHGVGLLRPDPKNLEPLAALLAVPA